MCNFVVNYFESGIIGIHAMKSLILVVVFIAVVLIIAPLKGAFEYDPDEGINLMKASLFMKGYSLYKEIWTDQPPILTVILSAWFKLLGKSVYNARVLILILSGLLLWAFYQILKGAWGHFAAFSGVLFLVLSMFYARLSVSVMVGLPALAFTMLSISFVTLYKKSALKRYLILAGIFLALALQTKLATVFLIPFVALEILRVKRPNLPVLSLWFGTFLVAYFSIAVVFFGFNFNALIHDLIKPHGVARAAVGSAGYSSLPVIHGMMLVDYDILLLAVAATLLLASEKKWRDLFPLLWLVSAYLILINHKPVWYHHYLLLSIPIAWLAAIGASVTFRAFTRERSLLSVAGPNRISAALRWLVVSAMILVIVRVPLKYSKMRRSLMVGTTMAERDVVALLVKYRKYTSWIIADRPIFAFYAGELIPPELAYISWKRRATKNMPPDYVINVLEKYRPEEILFARFQDYGPEIMSYIKKNYSRIYRVVPPASRKEINLYMRKDVISHYSGI